MPTDSLYPAKPRVLLTNDDGPPGGESPYIFALSMCLKEQLGWDVNVVIPSSQKSWIGKAYHIKEIVRGRYYYPKHPDGLGEISEFSRPLREGEVAEWILLDGTPATCANVAIHNLYPDGIDLVISGPNFGRNTSSAFALSSGTIGAAMSAALSKKRSIALSYGNFVYPTPQTFFDPANRLATKIISQLWDNWGADPIGIRGDGEVDLYNVNIPMVEKLLSPDSLGVTWSTMWRNSYGKLFQHHDSTEQKSFDVPAAGPDAVADTVRVAAGKAEGEENDGPSALTLASKNHRPLVFKFSPDMGPLVRPSMDSLPEGTDAWAVHSDFATVTPLRAAFAEPPPDISMRFPGDTIDQTTLVRHWKLKL